MKRSVAILLLALAAPAAAQQPPPQSKSASSGSRPASRSCSAAAAISALLRRRRQRPDRRPICADDRRASSPRSRSLDPDPVRFVINTHWHGDHTGGNENLGRAGTVIVAHRQCPAPDVDGAAGPRRGRAAVAGGRAAGGHVQREPDLPPQRRRHPRRPCRACPYRRRRLVTGRAPTCSTWATPISTACCPSSTSIPAARSTA